MFDQQQQQQPPPAPEAEKPGWLEAIARMLGLSAPPPDSTLGQAAEGGKILRDVVQGAKARTAKPEVDRDGLLVGDTREIIHENARMLRAKGLDEAEAVRRAQAAADRSRAAKKK
jgi:hypothetical protein